MIDLNPVDQYMLEVINRNEIPGFDGFFRVFTHLGSAAFCLFVFTLYFLAGKQKLVAAIFIIALLFGTVINEDIKNIVQRDRPEGAVVGIALTPVNYSFPSQHAQTAFMIAALAAVYFGIKYRLIVYIFAILVAVSRMYLGVHYLTDVAAGAVSGIIIAELVMLAAYLNGLTKDTGIIGYVASLAGLRPPTYPAPGSQMLVGLIILFAGIGISSIAMLTGQYAVSLVFIALVYLWILELPFVYAVYKG
ncbi:phosphatase PAP2 family protein [Methanocella sp. MCL-LM]|uniref:phosphatase PAP2 family protein n=1 Tax=Methanocella sp. MCL-LM TaxID=3412035 RepID=UPI003C710959